jgi:hypothetical protein
MRGKFKKELKSFKGKISSMLKRDLQQKEKRYLYIRKGRSFDNQVDYQKLW